MSDVAKVVVKYGPALFEIKDRCVRLPGAQPEFVAGRNDMLISVYLPYCKRFVVADWNQELCLREVASAPDVGCEVLPYRKLKSSFMVAA
jgi:hypothetical protein